jgi:hypothetical protein
MATIPKQEMMTCCVRGSGRLPRNAGVLGALDCTFFSKEKAWWLITNGLSAFTKKKGWRSEESVGARERPALGSSYQPLRDQIRSGPWIS